MTVDAPEPAARLAAKILVIMPPLPMLEPAPPAIAARRGSSARASGTNAAPGSARGSAVVKPPLGREDDQRVGLGEAGDQRRKGVVVAELDLGGAHRVVLVDDRDRPVGDDLAQGVTDAQKPAARTEVLVGEQYLRHRDSMRDEGGLPCLHQARLSDGGARLELGELGGAFLEPESPHAGAVGKRSAEHTSLFRSSVGTATHTSP